jgi:hypothetical protein
MIIAFDEKSLPPKTKQTWRQVKKTTLLLIRKYPHGAPDYQ